MPLSGVLAWPMGDSDLSIPSDEVRRWIMADAALGAFIRDFIERVVNRHDLEGIDQALDQMVSGDYVGTGSDWGRFASDFDSLRAFYHRQAIQRPDWHIDVHETIEVGEYVAVRALAAGKEALDDEGAPRQPPFPTAVEWLAVYHVVDGVILDSQVVTWLITSQARAV